MKCPPISPSEEPMHCDPSYEHQTLVREQLRQALLSLSFHAFEHCMLDLLVRMGYTRVSVLDRKHWKQRTCHGGLDLQASAETGVSSAEVLVQLKQYERPVSRRFIDELRGVMLRRGAGLGLILTTATIAKAARRAAADSKLAAIRLVDGEELLDLLFQHRVGVWHEPSSNPNASERWGIEEAFFTDLTERYPSSRHFRADILSSTPAKAPRSCKRSTNSLDYRNPSRAAFCDSAAQGGCMLWRTHLLAGMNSLWLLQIVPGAITHENIAPVIGFAALGALLPDLDATESKIKHITVGGVAPFAPLSVMLHRTFGHRGRLHSLAGLIAVSVLTAPFAWWIGWPPVIALMLGYASHLALDACTRSGIPLLWPKPQRYFLLPKPLQVITGSPVEDILLALLALVTLALLLQHLPYR